MVDWIWRICNLAFEGGVVSVDRVCKVTGCLIDDEQGGFRVGREYVDQIITVKQIGEKAQEIKPSVCGFYRFEEGIQ